MGRLLRARVSAERVAIDAPDPAFLMVAAIGGLMFVWPLATLFSALLGNTVLAWVIAILSLFTARIHLRVRPGRAWLVRTWMGIPYWATRRDATPNSGWTDYDFDTGAQLVLPLRPGETDAQQRTVLSEGPSGLSSKEIDTLAEAITKVFTPR